MASTRVYRTLAANSEKKGAISLWFKIGSGLGTDRVLICSYYDADYHSAIKINTDDCLNVFDWRSGMVSNYTTTKKLRDVSAWYHVVFEWDTTQVSAGDRNKLYINGVQETVFTSSTDYSSDYIPSWNRDYTLSIGARNSDQYWNGEMSHLYFIQGYAYAASTFGSTDATSGIWKINTGASVNYTGTGTNSSFLKMEDRTNLDLDSGSNANTFTTGGTGTATYDNPSNNFCTMNPLRPNSISQTYSNGNNTFIRTGTGGQMNGTLGITKGKWYYECLIDDYWQYIGWTVPSLNTSQTAACSDSGSGFYGVYANATNMSSYANGVNSALTGYTVMAAAQYISIAFDADNGELYYGTNGVWGNSSNPVTRTNPFLTSVPVTDFVVPAIGQGTGSRSSTIKMNFGNGYFGTTSSGTTEADDAGIGQFKYDVPAGFYTLCTKNIKAYG